MLSRRSPTAQSKNRIMNTRYFFLSFICVCVCFSSSSAVCCGALCVCVTVFDTHWNMKIIFKCQRIAVKISAQIEGYFCAIQTLSTSEPVGCCFFFLSIIHIHRKNGSTPTRKDGRMNSFDFTSAEIVFSNRMHRNSNLIDLSWFVLY